MAYQVIARRWRPQTFDDVVYQEHVSKTIRNSIKNGRVSHAYIFSGPRGVGKTSMARIIAKALNCLEGPGENPCGKCENCIEIRDGNSFDVIEIDGASNRGIENIRELRENVNFAPVKSRYKVYIIDEVHMLTKEAFNALLKTLEEPPGHIVFIFATTEIHKIPETILSRCQKYFFKKISVDVIVNHLKHIVKSEGYNVNEKSLYPIARAADGSMRDSQSLLDQVISFSEGEISVEAALSILGVVPFESYLGLMEYIKVSDVKGAMGEVSRISSLGIDIPRYAAGFLDVIRALRLYANGISVDSILGLSGAEIDMMKSVSGSFSDEEFSVFFHIMNELIRDLKISANERINLEMAILDMIRVRSNPSISVLLKKLEEAGTGKQDYPENAVEDTGTSGKNTSIKSNVENEINSKKDITVQNDDITRSGRGIKELWASFINDLRASNRRFLSEKLKVVRVSLENDILRILYPSGSEHSYYRKILDSKDIIFIEEDMSKRVGKSIRISIGEFGNSDELEDVPGSHELPPDGAIMVKNPELDEMVHPDENTPAVDKIMDAFQGQIINKGEK